MKKQWSKGYLFIEHPYPIRIIAQNPKFRCDVHIQILTECLKIQNPVHWCSVEIHGNNSQRLVVHSHFDPNPCGELFMTLNPDTPVPIKNDAGIIITWDDGNVKKKKLLNPSPHSLRFTFIKSFPKPQKRVIFGPNFPTIIPCEVRLTKHGRRSN